MSRDDALEQARRAGARRRALDEGRPLPPEPITPARTVPLPGDADTDAAASVTPAVRPSASQDLGADGTTVPGGSAPTATGADPAAATTATPAPASGPWFDARAFFLGWLAMVIALVVGLSGVLVVALGFATAYVLARRSRVVNGIVSVGGGVVAGVLALALLLVIGIVASG